MNSALADPRLPRLFWRRLAAFVIDTVAINAVLIAFSLVLVLVLPWAPRFFVAATTTCEPAAPSQLATRIEREWPLALDQSRINQICTTSPWGAADSRTFVSSVIDGKGFPVKRTISIDIDDEGTPVSYSPVHIGQGVLHELVPVLLFCLASAILVARFGSTPGKRLVALRVVQQSGEPPPFARAIKRETLRMLPLIIATFDVPLGLLLNAVFGTGDILLDLISAVRSPGAPLQIVTLLVSVLFLPLVGIVWWALPLIRWRGQMIYDRLAGCYVNLNRKSHTASSPASTTA